MWHLLQGLKAEFTQEKGIPGGRSRVGCGGMCRGGGGALGKGWGVQWDEG